MTSNGTSFPSQTMPRPDQKTLPELLSEPKKLQKLAQVLRTQGWEEVSEVLWAARQEHLERAVESEDNSQRDESRVVARWIKVFLTDVMDRIHLLDQQSREPQKDPDEQIGDSMPFDSDSGEEEDEMTGELYAGN